VIAIALLVLAVLDGWVLLRWVAQPYVGFGDVVAYLVFAGFLGVVVASRAASRVFGALRDAAATGSPAGATVGHGLVMLAAAALLAWPGPASDGVAVVLLVPWVGRGVARRIHARGRSWLSGRGVFVGAARPPSWGPDAETAHPAGPGRPEPRTRNAPRFDHPVA
jgi:UPF0716 family protein affecting phage T7 exclusion